jgi:hypothetical protein
LPNGGDFPDIWRTAEVLAHEALLTAAARLLCSLTSAGAWHADLNLKNIYIAKKESLHSAYLLDVDRVTFPASGDVADLNFKRLVRSARKWRDRWGLDFDERSVDRLAELCREMKNAC